MAAVEPPPKRQRREDEPAAAHGSSLGPAASEQRVPGALVAAGQQLSGAQQRASPEQGAPAVVERDALPMHHDTNRWSHATCRVCGLQVVHMTDQTGLLNLIVMGLPMALSAPCREPRDDRGQHGCGAAPSRLSRRLARPAQLRPTGAGLRPTCGWRARSPAAATLPATAAPATAAASAVAAAAAASHAAAWP